MDETTIGAVSGEVAEPQIDTSTSTDSPVQVEGVENSGVTDSKSVQDKETNSAFAEMRRSKEAAEQRAIQVERNASYVVKYSNLGVSSEADLKSQYGHQGINTWQDVDNYYAAQEMNIDPEIYSRITKAEQTSQDALDKLSKYERKELIQEQSTQLEKDPKWGSFFNSNKSDILATAETYGVDLNTAKLLVLEQKYAEPNMADIEQNAIKKYIENIKNGNAPVEGGGNSAIVTGSSTPKTWAEARKQSLAYLRGTGKP
jgi:hypothetical protein